jgi:hypothetical protein
MPYYAAGDYYGRGDYYRGDYYRGDPGLFGSIGKFLGKAAGGIISNVIPGGGLLTSGAKKLLGTIGGKPGQVLARLPITLPTLAEGAAELTRMRTGRGPSVPMLPPPPVQFLGGSVPQGTTFGGFPLGGFGGRRRMNALNKKALTRAERRINSFVKIARKCLRHTGYAVVSRAARGGKGGFPKRRRG